MRRLPDGSEYSDDQWFVMVGDIGAIHHPFNLSEIECEEYLAELRAKEARRRPCGFQAVWPEDPPLRRIA